MAGDLDIQVRVFSQRPGGLLDQRFGAGKQAVGARLEVDARQADHIADLAAGEIDTNACRRTQTPVQVIGHAVVVVVTFAASLVDDCARP